MTRDVSGYVATAISEDRLLEIADVIARAPILGGQEAPLAEAVRSLLEDGAADVHVQEVVPGRPNVVARRPGGARGRQLVLSGHLDCGMTSGWIGDPMVPRIEGGRLYAGGITDAKASLIAMIAAFEAAAHAPITAGELVVLAAMGHNPIGIGVKYAMASEGPWSGSAIFCQSSSMELHLANGGAIKFEVVVNGRSAHISQSDGAVDALAAAEEIAQRLRRADFTHETNPRLPDLPRIVVGELHAGVAPARIAGTAVIRGDVRTTPGMTRRSVAMDLDRYVADIRTSGLAIVVNVTHVQTPFLADEGGRTSEVLRSAYRQVMGEPLRTAAGLPTEAFITDAADLALAGLDTVMFGPGTWKSTPGDESVEIAEMANAARIYLATAMML